MKANICKTVQNVHFAFLHHPILNLSLNITPWFVGIDSAYCLSEVEKCPPLADPCEYCAKMGINSKKYICVIGTIDKGTGSIGAYYFCSDGHFWKSHGPIPVDYDRLLGIDFTENSVDIITALGRDTLGKITIGPGVEPHVKP